MGELYQLFVQSGLLSGHEFSLNASNLKALIDKNALSIDVKAFQAVICPLFPGGCIQLHSIRNVEIPSDGKPLVLLGTGGDGPFIGLDAELRIDLRTGGGAQQELVLSASASVQGDTVGWTIGRGFPAYRKSMLADLAFSNSKKLRKPFLCLHSHGDLGSGVIPGAVLVGELDFQTLSGGSHKLFLGSNNLRDKFSVAGLIIAAEPPTNMSFPERVLPRIAVGGTDFFAKSLSIGDWMMLEDLEFFLNVTPEFSYATRQMDASADVMWQGNLYFSTWPEDRRIPFGVVVTRNQGSIRFFSHLNNGLKLPYSELSSFIPNARLSVPNVGFKLAGELELRDFEVMLNTEPGARDLVEWVTVEVATAPENGWALIDHLVTLDEIELSFTVHRPASASRSVELALSGLMAMGERGLIRLTSSLSVGSGATDYRFYGGLMRGYELNVTEVLSHFLGRKDFAGLPELFVDDLSFSVSPKTRSIDGTIGLSGDWPVLRAGGDKPAHVLESVHFEFERNGEGDTRFSAAGAFELGPTTLFVNANFDGQAQGWSFEGGTAHATEIPVGKLIADAAKLFDATVSVPALIEGLSLSDVGVRFNTVTEDFSFSGTAAFPIDGKADSASKAKLTVHVNLVHDTLGGRQASFGGVLRLCERDFGVGIGTETGKADLLVASYAKAGGEEIGLRELVSGISAETANRVPESLKIKLNHAQLAFASDTSNRFLFGVELGAGIKLSQLPLVGVVFERDQTLAVTLQVLVANAVFVKDEIVRINKLSATSVTKLPEEDLDGENHPLQIRTQLSFGGRQFRLSLPLGLPTNIGPSVSNVPVVPTGAAEAMVQWCPVQQAIGAFHFQRVGVGLSADAKQLVLLLDASLDVAGLVLSLAGLGAELDLAKLSAGQLEPHFHLDGLGVDFKKGALEIGGALLRKPTAPGVYEYDGAVTVHYNQLGIVGLGSYAGSVNDPSMFVYALLDYPIGGPSFFFVEGLSFGFGYNRAMQIPALEQVSTFPLVALAQNPDPSLTPVEVAAKLAQYIRPAEGEYFIAAGIKFNSFKTLDGFVLLMVVFGQRFEVDLLGAATLTSPPRAVAPNQPLLMQAKLGIVARFQPDIGEVHVRGGLMPDAYLFAPGCHLTGGFAFSSWGKDTHFKAPNGTVSPVKGGDFVLTMGGYHAAFKRPAHYPQVPRLGLNWQVSPNLSLKADAYFALTPSAFMAGGHLRANWQSGDLHAWFNACVDCLVAWQPYHYEADVYVAIGASYRTWCHTFTVELSAKLEIWGPSFSGTAHVTWYVFSFDAAFGNKQRPALTPVKHWGEFQSAFLPKTESVLTIAAQAGKVAPHGKLAADKGAHEQANGRDKIGLVNARDLCISISSAIPLTNGSVLGVSLPDSKSTLGIVPMGATSLDTKVTVTLESVDQPHVSVNAEFVWEPVKQEVPAALWGTQGLQKRANANVEPLKPALTGFRIRPKPVVPHKTFQRFTAAKENSISAAVTKLAGGYDLAASADQNNALERVRQSVQTPASREVRQHILQAFLPDAVCDWSGMTVEAWRNEPQLVQVKTVA